MFRDKFQFFDVKPKSHSQPLKLDQLGVDCLLSIAKHLKLSELGCFAQTNKLINTKLKRSAIYHKGIEQNYLIQNLKKWRSRILYLHPEGIEYFTRFLKVSRHVLSLIYAMDYIFISRSISMSTLESYGLLATMVFAAAVPHLSNGLSVIINVEKENLQSIKNSWRDQALLKR